MELNNQQTRKLFFVLFRGLFSFLLGHIFIWDFSLLFYSRLRLVKDLRQSCENIQIDGILNPVSNFGMVNIWTIFEVQ